jgi:hypothetical protein
MRACARIALPSVLVFAGLALGGCAAVDELKDTMSGWFTAGKPSVGQDALPGDVPDPKDKPPPNKMPREQASKGSKNKDKQASKQQNQTGDPATKPPMTVSAEAVKPKRAEAESASSLAPATRLRTLWPDAPLPGAFAR